MSDGDDNEDGPSAELLTEFLKRHEMAKKAPNAYLCFASEMRAKSSQMDQKACSAAWALVSDADKAKWSAKSLRGKERMEKAIAEWEAERDTDEIKQYKQWARAKDDAKKEARKLKAEKRAASGKEPAKRSSQKRKPPLDDTASNGSSSSGTPSDTSTHTKKKVKHEDDVDTQPIDWKSQAPVLAEFFQSMVEKNKFSIDDPVLAPGIHAANWFGMWLVGIRPRTETLAEYQAISLSYSRDAKLADGADVEPQVPPIVHRPTGKGPPTEETKKAPAATADSVRARMRDKMNKQSGAARTDGDKSADAKQKTAPAKPKKVTTCAKCSLDMKSTRVRGDLYDAFVCKPLCDPCVALLEAGREVSDADADDRFD